MILRIKVKPNARTSELTKQGDGSYLAQLRAPPINGQANAELIELVARYFGVRKAQVSIKSGGGSRIKQVVIED